METVLESNISTGYAVCNNQSGIEHKEFSHGIRPDHVFDQGGSGTEQWRTSGGRTAPKKYYTATPEGHAAYAVQRKAWRAFADCVDGFDREEQL